MKERFTFMCVGVQKAGTSTFHDLMNQHPALHLPKYKETALYLFSNQGLQNQIMKIPSDTQSYFYLGDTLETLNPELLEHNLWNRN